MVRVQSKDVLSMECHAITATLCLVFFLLSGCATEQSKLARLAVVGKDADVRRAAVEKLTDQAVLAKIAVWDWDSYARLVAVDKLTDQAVLAEIATEDKRWSVRYAAVDKLTDETVLTKIAVEDKDADVRRAAVDKLTDQAVLAEIAVWDWDADVRRAAVEKLTDQAMLTKIAVEDRVASVRRVALDKLGCERPLAPEMPPGGNFAINLASFRQKQRADRYVEELKKLGIHAYSWEVNLPEKGRWYRVSVGRFPTLKKAKNYTRQLGQEGISDSFITKITEPSYYERQTFALTIREVDNSS